MRRLLPLLLGLALACSGQISDPTGAPPGPPGPEGPEGPTGPGEPEVCELETLPAGLRRLRTEELQATLRDLLGDQELEVGVEDGEVLTETAVRQLRDVAARAVEASERWDASVLPCDRSGARDDACAESFIDTFGRRAFRRPLSDDERTWLRGVYSDAADALGFGEALEVTAEVILQSPQLVWVDVQGTGDGDVRDLGDYELASRMSYFLWGTTPDDALLDAAERGELTGDGLRAQTERLLDDERAQARVTDFLWEYMQLDGGRLHHSLEELMKDDEVFDGWDDDLRHAMRVELEAFVKRTLDEGGGFAELLTSRDAYVNADLAALYGVDPPADEWGWVELPEGERAGILTRAAFLTVFGSHDVHSPIRRGVYVLEEVLCVELGDPPPDVDDSPIVPEEEDGHVPTVREEVEHRTAGRECQTCHGVINPVGFAFERYDGIGAYRGDAVDASGDLQSSDVDGSLEDAIDLSERLASSEQAAACFAERFAYRALQGGDECVMRSLAHDVAGAESLREMVLRVVESDAFRKVTVER